MSKYKTNAEFANAIGVTAGAVSQWKREDDWPVKKSGPWTEEDMLSVKAWRQTRKLDPTSPNVRMVDMRLKAERMLKVKLEREILQGAYIEIDSVKQEWAKRTRSIRGALIGVGASVAAKLPGKDAPIIQELIDDEITSRLGRYAKEGMESLENEP